MSTKATAKEQFRLKIRDWAMLLILFYFTSIPLSIAQLKKTSPPDVAPYASGAQFYKGKTPPPDYLQKSLNDPNFTE